MADFLLEGVSAGTLRPGIASESKKIAINFLAYLDGLALHSMIAGEEVDMRAQIDLFLKAMEPLLTADNSQAA